jgi:hypothetical protein
MANEFKVKNGLIVIGDLTTSGTITINGALAATQSWVTSQAYLTSASLSGYATQSYVTSALAALVDAAPAALDTLNELAAALGDDASFSTTITNSIASKLSLSGGTMTGQILFQTSSLNNGFRWDVNSDAAGITFKNTGDGDANSYFNFFTEDNANEYFKFSHNTWNIGSFDFMDVKNGIVRTNGDIYVNASQSGTRSAGTNELINGSRVWHAGDFSSTNISNWSTAYSWGNHALVGYLTTYTDTLATVTGRGATTTSAITVGTSLSITGPNRTVTMFSSSNYFHVQAYSGSTNGGQLWVGNDNDPGFYVNASQHFFRGLDSSNKMYINGTSGNVGIGTTSPSQKLNIEGNILLNLGGTLYLRDTTTYINEGSGLNLVSGATRSINLSAGGSERMRITATGDVGIGTSSPAAKLHISSGQIQIGDSSSNFFGIRLSRTNTAVVQDAHLYSPSNNSPSVFYIEGGYYNSEAAGTVTAANSGYAYYERYFGNGAANSYKHLGFINVANGNFTSTNLVSSITMLSNGNVGIGTTSPSDKLSVNGNIGVEYAGYFGFYRYPGAGHTFSTDGITSAMFGIASGIFNGRSDAGVTVSGYDQLRFYTENAERIRINRAGKVSIGTTDTNDGKSDFTVYTGGTTTLSLAGDLLRVGDSDVNWGVALRSNGFLETYNQPLYIRTWAGSHPVVIGPNVTNTVEFHPDYTLFNGLNLSISRVNSTHAANYFRGDSSHLVIGTGGTLYLNYGGNTTNITGNVNITGGLTLTQGIGQNNLVGRPYAVWGLSGTTTGAVVIKFPGNTSNYGMVHAVIDIYEYGGNTVSTIIVGGHNWGSQWYNYGANLVGQTDKQVRVAVVDGSYAIVIGDNSSSWSYGQVVLRKIQNGSYYQNIMNVSEGYTVTQTASLTSSWISGDLRQLTVSGQINASSGNSSQWNSAYSWGNHASAGYLTSVPAQSWASITGKPYLLTLNYDQGSAWAGNTGGSGRNIVASFHGLSGNSVITFGSGNGDLNISVDGNVYVNEGQDILASRAWVTSQSYITSSGSISGNAATATTFSTNRTNYRTVTDSAVVGQLMWKNYGNNHTIFDASNSTSPDGGSVSNTNAQVAWSATYPTLMGWNGSNTYGVRVDSARVADSATTANTAGALTSMNISQFTNNSNYVAYGNYSWTSPVFGQYGIKSNLIDNVLYSAADRFELFKNGVAWNTNCLFNLNYDQNCEVISSNTSRTYSIVLNTKGNDPSGITYTEGNIYLSFYYVFIPGSVSGRVRFSNGNWVSMSGWTNVANSGSYAVWRGNVPGGNYMVEIEITINASSSVDTWFAQWEYVMGRPGQYELGIFNKAQDNSIWRSLYFKDSSNVARVTINSGGISANTVTSNNFNVSNAIYFGAGNNYLNWTNSRIYSNVGIETANNFYVSGNLVATQSWVQSQNYLTSYSETDTLASVTGRGATTSSTLTSTAQLGLYVNSGSASYIGINSTSNWAYVSLLNNGSTIWDIGASNGGALQFRPYGGGTNAMYLNLDGSLFINSINDGKLNLRVPSGDSSEWNYINFTGSNGVRDAYFGTDGGGTPTWWRDDNGVNITLGSSVLINGNTAWHAGNDGAGSGLDADTVDGVQADSIVYGNARGTNQSITNNNNDLDKTGYYTADGFTTKPSGVANWMYIEHIKLYNDNTAYQKQLGYDTYDDRMWVRTKSGGAWSSWKQIWTSDVFANNSSNWNTAFGWGNHASAGYLTSVTAHTQAWSTITSTPTTISGYGITNAYTDAQIQNFFNGANSISGYNKSNWDTAYSWGNHASASYATTSYVTTQINNLINGAPGVLDTLDELAAALGDDANFATTVTNSIAGKVSKSGDTITGNLNVVGNIYSTTSLGIILNAADSPLITRGWDQFTSGPYSGVGRWGVFMEPSTLVLGTPNIAGNGQVAFRRFNPDGTSVTTLLINSVGDTTIYANLTVTGTITESSSLKLKENVETSEGNLEKVVNLRPVTYNKIGSQTTEIGLIAEEVAEVYPEFVQYDENGEPIGVNYSRLTAALIGAVKELTNQVQELNKKING